MLPVQRALTALAVMIAIAAEGTRAQNPTAPGTPARLLQIDAVAFDRNGNPVTDLQPKDFEVWMNGYRVPIETLTAVPATAQQHPGRVMILILDDVTVPPQNVQRVREVARRFVHKMMPEDRIAIVRLNGDSVALTSDPAPLLARIHSYNQSAGGIPVEHIGAHVLTTVASLSRQAAEASSGRKTIVAIGSGWLFDTPIPPPGVAGEVRREWLDAVRAMALADASFYVIDPGGVGSARAGAGSGGFARDSGGHAFINTNDLNGAVDRILREAANYYVIRVADPPVGRAAALRELDVRVLRRGITVRARRMIAGGA